MKKGFSFPILILSVFILLGITGGAYYLGTKFSSSSKLPSPVNTPKIQISSQPSKPAVAQSLFTGLIKKIDKDLGLFKISDIDKENGIPDSIVYYEAGVFMRGKLEGYTRILAIRPSEGPGPSLQFLLATKDFKTYLLDDPNNKTTNYPETDWDNPYLYIDKSKISKTTTFDSAHPRTISETKPFKLIKRDTVLTENKKTGKKDKNGNEIYQEVPISRSEKSQMVAELSLYYGKTDWGTGEGYNAKEKADLDTRKKYLNKSTIMHAGDSTGLTYAYILSTEKDIDSYLAYLASTEQKIIEYKKQVVLFNEKKRKEYPEYPNTVPFPGLRFTKSDIGLGADYYSKYDSAFPGACGGAQSTFVVDSIEESDLTPVQSSSEFPLFILKDTTHPLFTLAYNTKTGQGEQTFKDVNNGKAPPSLSNFIAQHPLLFFKDAWGSWAVIGEFDLQIMGGCGKPVIYLYPEKSTDIHVSFSSPVALNTNIPTYNNGWFVRADSDGTLTDLQPQYTNCSKIDKSHRGSEYATDACNNNIYPYIYWSGKSVENEYPKSDEGWVVEKGNLLTFMQGKLKEIGLTQKESNDMISYWVPKMNQKNAPFYYIRFIQTKEMNAFVPMNVNPMPDSVLRVFLDWKELNSKPFVTPVPQRLEKVSRKGFVYVEWGGLRR